MCLWEPKQSVLEACKFLDRSGFLPHCKGVGKRKKSKLLLNPVGYLFQIVWSLGKKFQKLIQVPFKVPGNYPTH